MDGNCSFDKLDPHEHVGHISLWRNFLLGWSYTEIRKFKKSVCKLGCDKCARSLVRVLCYFKTKLEQGVPKDFIWYLWRNTLLPHEQESFLDSCETFWSYCDLQDQYDSIGSDRGDAYTLKHTIAWYKFIEDTEDGLLWFPSLSPYPYWDLKVGRDKESKLYLTKLPPPGDSKVSEFRKLCTALIERYGPSMLPDITHEECMAIGTQKVYDLCEIKRDGDKPMSHEGPLLYQPFMTGPMSLREVWLPTRVYKYNSTYWNLVGAGLCKEVPWIVKDETDEDIISLVRSRWCTARTLDLKGCELQYPREYIITMMEVICEFYSNSKMLSELECTKRLFSDLLVETPDGFYHPDRGVGLGYYTSITALCTSAMLLDIEPIAGFADDLLIPDARFGEAVDIIDHFELVINDKKTGKIYFLNPYFVGMGMYLEDESSTLFTNEDAHLGAVYTKRFHWQRKEILAANLEDCVTVFHIEKQFGFEFEPGDYLNHPMDGGGYGKASPHEGDVLRGWPWGAGSRWNFGELPNYLEDDEKSDPKILHKKRKAFWRHAERVDSKSYHMVYPILEYHDQRSYIEKIKTPFWVENYLLKHTTFSFGKNRREVPHFIRDEIPSVYRLAPDIIHAEVSGGYEVLSLDPINAPVSDETRAILTSIFDAEEVPRDFLIKKSLSEEENNSILEGIDLENFEVDPSQFQRTEEENDLPPDWEEDMASDESDIDSES
jgi:hypothetical protein